jgi:hypothetical protein
MSGALHLDVFEQPEQKGSFSNLLVPKMPRVTEVSTRLKAHGARRKQNTIPKEKTWSREHERRRPRKDIFFAAFTFRVFMMGFWF